MSRWAADLVTQSRPALRVAVPLLLFVVALVALAGGWQQLASTPLTINPATAAASFLVLVLSSLWASLVWTYMARLFGAHLGWRKGVRIYATSNLGKYLPGKVGHVVARVYLAREQGVPLGTGATAVVVDIVLYVAAAMTFAVVSLPVFFPSFGALASLAGGGCIAVGLGLLHPNVLNRVLALLARRFPGGGELRLSCGYATVLGLYGLYLALILITSLGMILAMGALHPLPADALARFGAIYGVSYVAGLVVPLSPNGIGVREAVMATMLDGSMPAAVAGAGSLLFRVLQLAAEAACALVTSRM